MELGSEQSITESMSEEKQGNIPWQDYRALFFFSEVFTFLSSAVIFSMIA